MDFVDDFGQVVTVDASTASVVGTAKPKDLWFVGFENMGFDGSLLQGLSPTGTTDGTLICYTWQRYGRLTYLRFRGLPVWQSRPEDGCLCQQDGKHYVDIVFAVSLTLTQNIPFRALTDDSHYVADGMSPFVSSHALD